MVIKRHLLVSFIIPVSVVIIGTIILLLAGHGESRFHIPFMPFIIMLAAAFLSYKEKSYYEV